MDRRRALKYGVAGTAGVAVSGGLLWSLGDDGSATVPPDQRPDAFVERDGTRLTLDGEPVRLFGTRPKYVMNFKERKPDIQRTLRGDRVGQMFDHVARMGGTLARVHAFQPFWGETSMQPEPGECNETVMRRLDRVIEAARNRGIRLSLMLVNGKPAFHHAEGMDDNYGVNVHTYARHAETAEGYDDFYTDPRCRELYRRRVEAVLTRENTITGVEYREDPTIAMWELGNEIEWEKPWTHDDPSLRPWVEEMAAHVKSIDDNHLVTTGEFGWAGRNDFLADHAPDTVDCCSVHYYPGPLAYDLASDPERSHPEFLAALVGTGQRELGKPVYVGEYNWKVPEGADPPFPERNEELRAIHEALAGADTAAAAFHALGRDAQENYPRVPATTYADTDEGSMAEFRRFARTMYEASAGGRSHGCRRSSNGPRGIAADQFESLDPHVQDRIVSILDEVVESG